MKKVSVFTDGGSRGNPGPGGAGWVVLDEDGVEIKRNSKFLGKCTNNWAEYEAASLALNDIKKTLGSKKLNNLVVELYMDSELVAKQISGEYQIKEESLYPQFIKVHNLKVKHFPNLVVKHVKREKNKVADSLANEAMDGATKELI